VPSSRLGTGPLCLSGTPARPEATSDRPNPWHVPCDPVVSRAPAGPDPDDGRSPHALTHRSPEPPPRRAVLGLACLQLLALFTTSLPAAPGPRVWSPARAQAELEALSGLHGPARTEALARLVEEVRAMEPGPARVVYERVGALGRDPRLRPQAAALLGALQEARDEVISEDLEDLGRKARWLTYNLTITAAGIALGVLAGVALAALVPLELSVGVILTTALVGVIAAQALKVGLGPYLRPEPPELAPADTTAPEATEAAADTTPEADATPETDATPSAGPIPDSIPTYEDLPRS